MRDEIVPAGDLNRMLQQLFIVGRTGPTLRTAGNRRLLSPSEIHGS